MRLLLLALLLPCVSLAQQDNSTVYRNNYTINLQFEKDGLVDVIPNASGGATITFKYDPFAQQKIDALAQCRASTSAAKTAIDLLISRNPAATTGNNWWWQQVADAKLAVDAAKTLLDAIP